VRRFGDVVAEPVASRSVHILVATDAEWVLDEVKAALDEPGTTFVVCRDGREVVTEVLERIPDLAVLDLQIGSMGGIAVTMSLRLDESSGRHDHVRVLMLLDRAADLHLARRADAEGWLIRPLDALRLRRAATAIIAGGRYTEGLPTPPQGPDGPVGGVTTESIDPASSRPDGEPATTG
jgi:DNA-binding response OmpR family regulator